MTSDLIKQVDFYISHEELETLEINLQETNDSSSFRILVDTWFGMLTGWNTLPQVRNLGEGLLLLYLQLSVWERNRSYKGPATYILIFLNTLGVLLTDS